MKKAWAAAFALIISIVWTYVGFRPGPSYVPVQEVSLAVIPDYSITTGKATSVWPAGTALEQGSAAYFYAARPVVKVSPIVEAAGMDRGRLDGTIQTRVVLQAVNEKSSIYWSYKLKEAPKQAFTLSKGITGAEDRTRFTPAGLTVDAAEAYELVAKISSELNFQSAVFQLVFTSDISLSGTVNGNNIEKTLTQTLPIVLQQTDFSIPKPEEAALQAVLVRESAEPSLRQVLTDMAENNAAPLFIDFVLLALLIVLVVLRKANRPKASVEHKRFKEWITEGSVDIRDKFCINIFKLEGLIDLAIDLDKRVIYDSGTKKYFVLEENLIYMHDPGYSNALSENRPQLGRLLLERGILRPEQLETGLYYHQRIGCRLGEGLIALGFIDEITLYSTLAAQQKVNYLELDPEKTVVDTGWLEKLSLKKARALQALPLGKRSDGRLVIACSEVSREGIQKAMQEIFGSDILMVAARPSAIFDIIERLDTKERQKSSSAAGRTKPADPSERLTDKESDEFIASYIHGSIKHGYLLKAAGLVDMITLARAPEQEPLAGWLVNKNIIGGDIANMLRGLDDAIRSMDRKSRQERQLPGLLELLEKADYLTSDAVEWVNNEQKLQGLPVEQLLSRDFLASVDTVNNAKLILDTLSSILKKA